MSFIAYSSYEESFWEALFSSNFAVVLPLSSEGKFSEVISPVHLVGVLPLLPK